MPVGSRSSGGWRVGFAVLACCIACGSCALGEQTSTVIGQVIDGELHPLGTGGYLPTPYRLTSIRMQEARSPEVGELDLRPYEGRVLVVEGQDAGGWLFSASILEVAPSLIGQYLITHSRPGKLCEFDVVLPLMSSPEQALDVVSERLEEAEHSIDVLTSLPEPWLAECLAEGARRGVTVRLLITREQHAESADLWDRLRCAGVQLRYGEESAHTFLIVDNVTVVLGIGGLAEEGCMERPTVVLMDCPILTAALTPVELYAQDFMSRWTTALPVQTGE